MVLQYVEDLFRSSHVEEEVMMDSLLSVRPSITQEDNEILVANFMRKEFKVVIMQMHPDKPDRFKSCFLSEALGYGW